MERNDVFKRTNLLKYVDNPMISWVTPMISLILLYTGDDIC